MIINAANNHRSSYDRRHDVELVPPLGVQFDELAAILDSTATAGQKAAGLSPDVMPVPLPPAASIFEREQLQT